MSNSETNQEKDVSDEQGEGKQEELLKLLEEQNRLLESDSRYAHHSNPDITTMNTPREASDATPMPSSAVPSPPSSLTPTASLTRNVSTPLSSQQAQEHSRTNSSTSNVVDQANSSITSTPNSDNLPNSVLSGEEMHLNTWSNLVKTWEESWKKNPKMIRLLARKGVPDPLRGIVWQLMANASCHELKAKYPSLITEVSPFEKQIQRDLTRTFPEHQLFKERDGRGQESLMNVMKAYSVYDKEVGYCQGSLFLAGVLLMHMPEEETFCVFAHLMYHYRLRELYKPSMADLALFFYQLECLVEELFPQLHIHFKALDFQTSMYSSPWFLTLFASTLPLSVTFRVMDLFLVEGMEVIFRVGLALLEHSHDKLITLDLEDMTKLFQKEVKTIHEADPDGLIERAFRIKLPAKRLKRLEKEFLQKKEKQALESTELKRYQQDNVELEKRVVALEKECAQLADRLLQDQVTRSKEVEQKDALRRECYSLREQLVKLKRQNIIHQPDEFPEQHEKAPTPGTTPPASNKEKKSSSLNRKKGLRKSISDGPSSSPPLRHASVSSCAVASMRDEENDSSLDRCAHCREITRELAGVKLAYAEAMNNIECQKKDLREASLREAKLQQTLDELSRQRKEEKQEEERVRRELLISQQQLRMKLADVDAQPKLCTRCKHHDQLESSLDDADTSVRYTELVSTIKGVLDSATTSQTRSKTASDQGAIQNGGIPASLTATTTTTTANSPSTLT